MIIITSGFVKGSLRVKNQIDEEYENVANPDQRNPQPVLPNGDFLHLRTVDEENTIEIDYVIRSDFEQLQPIQFDMVFTQKINRIRCQNYIPTLPREITNNTEPVVINNDELEEFSLCLEYEVDCLDLKIRKP